MIARAEAGAGEGGPAALGLVDEREDPGVDLVDPRPEVHGALVDLSQVVPQAGQKALQRFQAPGEPLHVTAEISHLAACQRIPAAPLLRRAVARFIAQTSIPPL